VADCIAHQKALLWPPRQGFREDQLMRKELGEWARHREMPLGDFREGKWCEHIRAMLQHRSPQAIMRSDGGAVCAAWLDEQLSKM